MDKTINIRDKAYNLVSFNLQTHGAAILEWAKSKLPSPLEDALKKLDKIPKHLQESLLKEALKQDRSPVSWDDPAVMSLLATPEGAAKVFSIRLGVPEDEVAQVIAQGQEEYGADEFAKLIQ
jgi:hypothetical protein